MPFSATEQQLRRQMGIYSGLPCLPSPTQDEQGHLIPPPRPEEMPGYGVLGVDPDWWKRRRQGGQSRLLVPMCQPTTYK